MPFSMPSSSTGTFPPPSSMGLRAAELPFLVCRLALAYLLACCPLDLPGQPLRGPVVGGVTPTSATVMVAAPEQSQMRVVYFPWKQATLADTLQLSRSLADPEVFRGQLSGLRPDTRYRYVVLGPGASTRATGQFCTAPLPSADNQQFRFGFFSCLRGGDTPLPGVRALRQAKPDFVIQTGDWGYYDTTDNFPADTQVYPLEPSRIQAAYYDRYTQPQMPELLRSCGLVYTWDDHDWMNDNSSAYHFTQYRQLKEKPIEVPFPPQAHRNSLAGYRTYAPHYPLPDRQADGIYQRFRWGPAEFFVLDTRSQRTPNLGALHEKNGRWRYLPGSEERMLGEKQLQWLLDGLADSKAQWKFVVTSVAFNTGLESFVHQALARKNQEIKVLWYKFPSENLAAMLMDSWPGFAYERNRILKHCRQQNIQNVVFLSGDTHIAALDDGSNAGYPELMSGGMTRGSKKAYWLSRLFRTNAWNTHAQGKDPSKVRNAFGLVDVYGSDSLTLRTVDEQGRELWSHTFYPGLTAAPELVMNPEYKSHAWLDFDCQTRSNPPAIRLRFDRFPRRFGKAANLVVRNSEGEPILNKLLDRRFRNTPWEPLGAIEPGYYFVGVESIAGKFYRRVWIGPQ